MEVHHHPHIEKKGFKEYFLEFLMIFLAVTLGFFAENIREHFIEKKIARQYLETFRQELIHNKSIYDYYDSGFKPKVPKIDSLVNLFVEKKENQNLFTMARLTKSARSVITPAIDKSAYEQLVNSGGLKYLDNVKLKDSLSKYAGLIKDFEMYNSNVDNYRASAFPNVTGLEDYHDLFNHEPNHVPVMMPYPKFTELQRREITNFYSIYRVRYEVNIEMLKRLNNMNTHLMDMIENELKK
ncbi:MAG TPA: hypothetical protein VET23_05350 [Chitinophagaceae bacterium]|nr:hypothetical protein [Chitinophagaceae bacterium]